MYRQKGLLLLYSCFNMRRQLNRFISGGNLSQGEYLVLRNIRLSNKESKGDGREGTLKAADLSDMLELSRPSITRILNALENRGYITRSIDPKDRRSIRMELTDAGNEAFDLANRRIADTAERIAESLGEDDTDKLTELLDKLAEVYKKMFEEKEGEKGERS
ncbi:MAG: MarR family winged helix-turn-helix transcriptional regulator [Clostridia bacterium]|jgi:DNA-binding MarR family transcriptional regulator